MWLGCNIELGKNCPESSSSDAGSVAITDCAGNMGYSGNASVIGGACFPCVAGKYKDTVVNTDCTDCVANSSSDAGTDCACNAGYSSNFIGGGCLPCVDGKYKDTMGNTDCTDCVASSTSGAGSDGISDCACNAGYSGDARVIGGACFPCVTGKYKDTVGNQDYSDCPSGKYQSTAGSTGCKECPD